MSRTIRHIGFVRDINEQAILAYIRAKQSCSRADIAREVGLNPSTVTKITRVLQKRGLIQEVGFAESSGGRPPVLLQLDPTAFLQVGVQVLPDLRVVVMDATGQLLAQHTQTLSPYINDISEVRAAVEATVQQAGLAFDRLQGVGLGITGWVDAASGIARFSPNVGWQDVAVVEALQEAWDVPIYIDNDVRALALGQYWFGAGQGVSNLAVVTVADGVGSALLATGQPYRGYRFRAGELGHMVIDPNGQICTCGRRGCLETVVGSRALLAAARVAMGGRLPDAADSGRPSDQAQVEHILALARQRHRTAAALLDRMALYLGLGLANLVNLQDPEKVLLAGSLIESAGDMLLPQALAVAQEHVFGDVDIGELVATASLGSYATAIGAATLVIQHTFGPKLEVAVPAEINRER